jgi:hypothetical protein
LQAKKKPGAPSKEVTQVEFCDNMVYVVGDAMAKSLEQLPREQAEKILQQLRFSSDYAAVHQCADKLQEVAGIGPSQRAPLAPWGPDMQQPVEHAHGRFKSAMREMLEGKWKPEDMDEVFDTCQEVWEKVTPVHVVNADVDRLTKLYEYVATVSKGGWALKSLS